MLLLGGGATFWILCRLSFLTEVIGGLKGANEVSWAIPSEYQYTILSDVENVLSAPAELQEVLEGENYVTVWLATYAIHKIRYSHKDVMNDDVISVPAKYLAKILLEDLDTRYEPTKYGKVQ